jgi:hypothetical protein
MPNKSKSDGSISAIDTVIILSAAVGIPLFLGWVGKNPVRNMQTTFQILKAIRGAVSMMH